MLCVPPFITAAVGFQCLQEQCPIGYDDCVGQINLSYYHGLCDTPQNVIISQAM